MQEGLIVSNIPKHQSFWSFTPQKCAKVPSRRKLRAANMLMLATVSGRGFCTTTTNEATKDWNFTKITSPEKNTQFPVSLRIGPYTSSDDQDDQDTGCNSRGRQDVGYGQERTSSARLKKFEKKGRKSRSKSSEHPTPHRDTDGRWHLKHSEFSDTFLQTCKRRGVLRGDNLKDVSGCKAVITEKGASAASDTQQKSSKPHLAFREWVVKPTMQFLLAHK